MVEPTRKAKAVFVTKQQLLEAGISEPSRPLKKWCLGRLFMGFQWADDFWLTVAKAERSDPAAEPSIEKSLISMVVVTQHDDQFLRIIVFKAMFMIAWL